MRIRKLKTRNFRGLGSAGCELDLDADLVLFGGPNAFGKTSLVEALEWLFYGTTRRRAQGEKLSRSEYSGSLANAHATGAVEVEAEVELDGGARFTLGRRMQVGDREEVSETLIDGSVRPFAEAGVNLTGVGYPIVTQQGLQSFILSRPKKRRDAIGAALGLAEISVLKTATDGAARSLSMAPPRSIRETRQHLAEVAVHVEDFAETSAVGQRWARVPPEVRKGDISRVVAAARRLTGEESGDDEVVLEALREKRRAVSRVVFDDALLSTPANLNELCSAVEKDTQHLQATFVATVRAFGAVVAEKAEHAAELLSWWAKGLELAPSGEDCPMCESPTLKREKRVELQTRIDAGASGLKQRAALKGCLSHAEAEAPILGSSLADGRARMPDERREFLRGLFAEDQGALEELLAAYDSWLAGRESFLAARREVIGLVGRVREGIEDAAQYPGLMADLDDLPVRLFDAAAGLVAAARQYEEQWKTFEPKLSARVSRSSAVARIDALGKSLQEKAGIEEVVRYDKVLSASRSVARKAEAFLQRKQREILALRGEEVRELYKLLNPGAQVGFESMEPGNEAVKLHAQSFGVRMSAAANLSECQLNCLGLAFWIMQATDSDSPAGFIVLDDPVQSMDDHHTEAFKIALLPYLLDKKGKQVILLSHVKQLVESIRQLNLHRRIREYRFESYTKDGPEIVEQVRLARKLAEIEGLARGNEANRELGVDRLRVLVEAFVRELHLQETGQPAPQKFDTATASGILGLFQVIPGTEPKHHAGLRDTVDFADPAHHTEVGYSVPVSPQIQPHIDRLRTYMRHFKLIS